MPDPSETESSNSTPTPRTRRACPATPQRRRKPDCRVVTPQLALSVLKQPRPQRGLARLPAQTKRSRPKRTRAKHPRIVLEPCNRLSEALSRRTPPWIINARNRLQRPAPPAGNHRTPARLRRQGYNTRILLPGKQLAQDLEHLLPASHARQPVMPKRTSHQSTPPFCGANRPHAR